MFKMDVLENITRNRVHEIYGWYEMFIKDSPIGDLQKSHIKSGPANMAMICGI